MMRVVCKIPTFEKQCAVGRKILVQKANSCMTKILPKESRNMIGLHSKETTRSFTYRTAASQYFPSYRSVRTFCTVSGSKPALPIIRDLNNCITFILHSINICTAIEKKDDATTARLLSQITKDYSKQDYSQFLIEPFERAIKRNSLSAVKLLAEHTPITSSLLKTSVVYLRLPVLQFLVDKTNQHKQLLSELTNDYDTIVAGSQDTEVLTYLLSKGMDINIRNQRTQATLLHKAAEETVGEEDPSFVTYLLGKGANPKLVDYMGRTPLHISAMEGTLAALKALLYHYDSGAIIQNDSSEFSPLAYAKLNEYTECYNTLLHRYNEDSANKDKIVDVKITTTTQPSFVLTSEAERIDIRQPWNSWSVERVFSSEGPARAYTAWKNREHRRIHELEEDDRVGGWTVVPREIETVTSKIIFQSEKSGANSLFI